MFTLVVFTLVTAPRRRDRSRPPSTTSTTFGGGFDIRAGTGGARARSPTCAPRSRPPRARAGRLSASSASQSVLAVEAHAARHRAAVRGVPRPRARQLVPRAHDVPARRASRAATRTRARCGTALQEHAGLAVVDSLVVPRRDKFGFDVDAVGLQAHGLLLRRREAVRPDPGRGARQADRREDEADDHRRPRRHRAVRDESASRRRSRRSPRRSPGAPSPRSTTSRVAPGVDPDAAARPARGGVPRERPGGRVDPAGRRRRRSPRTGRSTG